jgi:hypothetical protein
LALPIWGHSEISISSLNKITSLNKSLTQTHQTDQINYTPFGFYIPQPTLFKHGSFILLSSSTKPELNIFLIAQTQPNKG